MNKESFIVGVSPILKAKGYKKNKQYWYKKIDGCILCINVQGSQWDKDTYYINIGASDLIREKPTELYWFCRHRCFDKNGKQENIPLDDFMEILAWFHESVLNYDDVMRFIQRQKTTKVLNQYQFRK